MRQRDYRYQHKISVATFADSIGVSEVAAWRYENGRVPEAAVMARIIATTAGAVTANDYFDMPALTPGDAA